MDWREREQQRFAIGTYKTIPWFEDGRLEPIKDHFAHISIKNPNLIAYTENPNKGERDRQTPMKPGRYLRAFYSNILSNDQIRDYAAEIGGRELKFAVTAKEIREVYRNGPDSCMSYDEADYESFVHPVSAYGNSDIQLAYLENEYKEITARCLVWPAKKFFLRPYGDGVRLSKMLKDLGYKRRPHFAGAKLTTIKDPHTKRLVGPFIDGARRVRYENGSVFICLRNHKKAIDAEYTSGFFGGSFCASCDKDGKEVFIQSAEKNRVHFFDNDLDENKYSYYCENCIIEKTLKCEATCQRWEKAEKTFVQADICVNSMIKKNATVLESYLLRELSRCELTGVYSYYWSIDEVKYGDERRSVRACVSALRSGEFGNWKYIKGSWYKLSDDEETNQLVLNDIEDLTSGITWSHND
jgi:thiol-disulfide isomerase/thioredoxin